MQAPDIFALSNTNVCNNDLIKSAPFWETKKAAESIISSQLISLQHVSPAISLGKNQKMSTNINQITSSLTLQDSVCPLSVFTLSDINALKWLERLYLSSFRNFYDSNNNLKVKDSIFGHLFKALK